MAEQYKVQVRMKAGPFKIDDATPSVIRASELRGPDTTAAVN